jgi:hypothetical protein
MCSNRFGWLTAFQFDWLTNLTEYQTNKNKRTISADASVRKDCQSKLIVILA